jgi:hypothetical protein
VEASLSLGERERESESSREKDRESSREKEREKRGYVGHFLSIDFVAFFFPDDSWNTCSVFPCAVWEISAF